MKNDENHPDLQTHIEPELEARLVASVLGEASAFESAELERLVSEKPELAIFKRRIEAVHGLVGPAMRPDQAPLRLAPERRAKILETIGAAPVQMASTEPSSPGLIVLETARRKRRKKWVWASSLAASVMFATVFTVQFWPSNHELADRENAVQYKPSEESRVAVEAPEPRVALSRLEMEPPALTEGAPRSPSRPAQKPSQDDALQQRPMMYQQGTVAGGQGGQGGRGGGAGGGGGGRGGRAKQSPTTPVETGGVMPRTQDAPNQPPRDRDVTISAGIGGSGATTLEAKEKAAAGTSPFSQGFFTPPASRLEKDSAKPDAIVLNPFKVSTDRDAGYAAGNTLSGGRLDTPLAVTPGSLSVVTKEFMDDFGIGAPPANATNFGGYAAGSLRPNAASFDEKARVSPRGLADGFLTDLNNGGNMVVTESAFIVRRSSPTVAIANDKLQQSPRPTAVPPPQSGQTPRGEVSAANEPVSTFSLHVSDVSFRLAQTALARGETPDPTRIRPEEFYNAFNYGDPAPTTGGKISARIEQAAHPLFQQRNLVRIAMKVASSGRGAGQPLHLTILLDTSGSMEREDRILSVRRALDVLASLLGKNDRVTLIGFSRTPRLLVEHLAGDQAGKLGELASNTPFTGGTNLEEALKLSGELARRHRDPAAQNRIVLITDGAANLGNADPAQLATMVEALRQQNIALDVCGVGTDGLDDTVLEALTRKGDGRYYVINKPEDADAGFARQLAGAFRPAAENVKVQIRFNPARVGSYRLIGFEQHRLREEDFRNDKVDAAELAAEEAAVALYQVEVLPQGEGELGDVFVRFRDAATGSMVERSWTMLHESKARPFDRATPSIQLAGTAALLAEKLQGSDAANLINLDELVPTVNRLRGHYAGDTRVQELVTMFEQVRRRNGR